LTLLPPSSLLAASIGVPDAPVGHGNDADEWKASRVARSFTGTPVAADSSCSALIEAASSPVVSGRRTTSRSHWRYQ
jgi:hypothetical protein